MKQNKITLPKRLPAEWERVGGVLLAWPHENSDWAEILPEIDDCYIRICEAFTQHTTVIVVTKDHTRLLPLILNSEIRTENLIWHIAETNDTWTRDFGPIVTTTGPDDWQINDFKFNGWGLKFPADKDNLITANLVTNGSLIGDYVNFLSFVLEGGSIESDGHGTIMTTSRCLLSANRNGGMTKEEIEEYLKTALGAQRILWVNEGALEGDDTDSHIDTLARFAPEDTIVYVGTEDTSDSHYKVLAAMKEELQAFRTFDGSPYRLIELPLPDAIYDKDGNRLPATYVNFLIVNDVVFCPVYGQKIKDDLAVKQLTKAFPGRTIVTIDCNSLIFQHGSLHCATMQLPYEVLPLCETPLI